MQPQRTQILGIPVDDVNMHNAILAANRAINENQRAYTVVAINPEKVMAMRTRPNDKKMLEDAGLLIPDGIGVVAACRWLGRAPNMERVAGADLMPSLCALAAKNNYRVFMFGATPEVNALAAQTLQKRIPGLQIAGTQHGYVGDDDMESLLDRINASNVQLLFVALGSPRQEGWIRKYAPRLSVNIIMGVGGTFDVIAGRVKRAPEWWQRRNLEWLYRLITEPKRLVRQMVLPLFVWNILLERVTQREWAVSSRS